ncbi:MAG: ABC transporter substrate-binding protein [Flavobacteriaceae bacterium]
MYDDFKILKTKEGTQNYILHQKDFQIPDSLKTYESVVVPVQTIVVTSTTHIPSLEMLGVENTLVGFPGLDYISSEKVRNRIETNHVKEVGQNERLNSEILIDLAPEMVVSFTITETNQTLETLKNAGLKVLLNDDWNEKHPLGKAEWIKFFGALYDLDTKASDAFENIKSDYEKAKQLAQTATNKPAILSGTLYEDVWYLPKGDSWSSQFLTDANTEYYWKDSSGVGSLALSFEEVFATAQQADYWIGAGIFTSLDQMQKSNPHYANFESFKNKKVYSYTSKKGKTGGVLYYELAPNRPDLVLKDIIKITHPELLPDYELQFFEALK